MDSNHPKGKSIFIKSCIKRYDKLTSNKIKRDAPIKFKPTPPDLVDSKNTTV